MPVEYAHALTQSLEGVTDEALIQERINALVAVLKKNGKQKALPAIVRELARIEARARTQQPTLFIAHESDKEHALRELHAKLGKEIDVEIRIDEKLTGGWRYIDSDTLMDTSYKAALLELYRRITT